MGLVEIFLIAIGLSMDAFAVSISLGLSAEKPALRDYLIPGLFFGFFQALMPAIGYFSGNFFAAKIQNLDHWIAFILLGFIGGKMIKDSFKKDGKNEEKKKESGSFLRMLILAIATSIDALAVGITFAFFKVHIIRAITITGLVTFFISLGGVKIGSVFGIQFKSKAELAGGLVLVLIGIRILIEHLLSSGV